MYEPLYNDTQVDVNHYTIVHLYEPRYNDTQVDVNHYTNVHLYEPLYNDMVHTDVRWYNG
jgi:hypothetical protein